MNIYLIRHGIPENVSLTKNDADRKLTEKGIAQMIASAKDWKIFQNKFDWIVTSPLIRAVQTAEIIAKEFEIIDKMIVDNRLALNSKTEHLIDLVDELDGDDIALVAHEPDLSSHLSNLVSSSGANFTFQRGMMAKISFNGKMRLGKGVLEFMIPAILFYK